MTRYRLLLAALLVALAGVALWLDAGRLLSLDGLQDHHARLAVLVDRQLPLAAGIFLLCYTVVAALSIPGGALLLTLAGGALFGLPLGTLLVSAASTLGAVAALLLSRFLLRELVERSFPHAIERVNNGLREEGGWYLLALRLVPVFPFFIVNLVMGLTRMPPGLFAAISLVGMLPVTLVYVNAGTRLAAISNPGDILSPGVLGSLAALALVPLVVRRLVATVRRRHA